MTAAATICIPSYNHARYLSDAIESAIAQTVPVEIVVIDDGSTDETPAVCYEYRRHIRSLRMLHSGVAAARNAGCSMARSSFVMFLDADDVIAPKKIELQLEALRRTGADWCLCDVEIVFETGVVDVASKRYGYEGMALDGNISRYLEQRNFIPVMAPLVRAEAIRELRFPDGPLEDWSFWRALAATGARVTYVPEALATYRRRRAGRHNAKP